MGKLLRASSSAATFKAAFTVAEGWRSFEQTIRTGALHPVIKIKYGQLPLTSMTSGTLTGATFGMATVTQSGASCSGSDRYECFGSKQDSVFDTGDQSSRGKIGRDDHLMQNARHL
jgi:hypothetical protein